MTTIITCFRDVNWIGQRIIILTNWCKAIELLYDKNKISQKVCL